MNPQRLAEINAILKGGSKIDKAQNYDKDVGNLLARLRILENELRFAQSDKDRLKMLERLEAAVMSVGYSRGPTG